MKVGLRLLLLAVALVAVVFGYARYQLIYLNARRVSRANGPIADVRKFAEANGATSRINFDANGEVVSARMAGPVGFGQLRAENSVAFIQRLSLDSQAALDAFAPPQIFKRCRSDSWTG